MPISEKFYLVLNAFLLFGVVCIIVNIYRSSKKRSTNIFLRISLILGALGLLDILDMFFLEPNWITTEKVKIKDPELAHVLKGLTVVQISDVHLKEIGFREHQLVEKVNELKPDILFFTGDFFKIDHARDGVHYFGAVSELIRSMKVSIGIFGVLGNYDGYLFNNVQRLKELKLAGIDILQSENRRVSLPNDKVLWLSGSYYDSDGGYSNSSFDKALEGIPPNSPIILLNHYPDVFGKAFNAGVNLVLAGHTHGGQIGIPFLIHMSHSANKSPYMRGLFDSGKTKMYVNRGIGTTNIPVRFLCRPEITVFEFVA
jgi:predicted MPP superfamily phosphohydrolase